MNSILPNLRLICLPSENFGEDWYDLTLQIDDALLNLGMDLSEEQVYLLFDRSPGAILHHEGSCMVGRPVVGPKKEMADPFKMVDWVSAPVHRKILTAKTWKGVLDEAYKEWEYLQELNQKTARPFFLCIRRRLKDALLLEIEAIFSE